MSSHLAEIPLWAALVISALVLLGSGLTLLGTIGLVRLSSFYDRIHAPTLGTSWGAAGIILGSALMFSLAGERVIIHEVVIAGLIMTTTPATLMILGRAALFRDADTDEPRAARPDVLRSTMPDADPAERQPEQTG